MKLLQTLKSLFTSKSQSSNYGRLDGWYIEFNGEVIGELVNYEYMDMFWDSYRIVPYDDAGKQILADDKHWDDSFRFRNKRNSRYARNPFWGSRLPEDRISMRALHVIK